MIGTHRRVDLLVRTSLSHQPQQFRSDVRRWLSGFWACEKLYHGVAAQVEYLYLHLPSIYLLFSLAIRYL